MSGVKTENCLFCFNTTQHLSLKDVKKEPTKRSKLTSAVCSLLNLPNPPYDKVLESSIFCNDCFGMLHKVEQILEDLQNVQLKMLEAKNEIEKELTKSIRLDDQQDKAVESRARDSLNSRNRTKIFEKINSSWDEAFQINYPAPQHLSFPLSSLVDNFDPDPDFTIDGDGVSAILNSIKKEHDKDFFSDVEFEPPYNDDEDDNSEDQLLPNSEESASRDKNKKVKIKPSQVLLHPLDLPLEYFGTTFNINEDYIQSYIQRDSKSINQMRANRQARVKLRTKEAKKSDLYCHICNLTFLRSSRYDEHLKIRHSDKRPFKCDLCSKSFKVMRYLRDHLRLFHKRKAKKTLPVNQGVRHHSKRSGSDRSRTEIIKVDESNVPNCEQCGYIPENIIDFYIHNASEHEDKKRKVFDCPLCHLKISSKLQRFKEHLQLHGESKPFVCSCGSKFKVLRYLRDHARNMGHTNDYSVYTQESKSEIKLESKRKPKSDDSQGQDTEFDDENEISDISGLENKSTKRVETINYDNAEPPTCDECGYASTSIVDFHLHIFDVHETDKQKQYSCPLCDKIIARAARYKEHLQIHGEERPFICHCGSAFKLCRYLQDHKKLSHGVVNDRRKSKLLKSLIRPSAEVVSTVAVSDTNEQRQSTEYLCNTCGKFFTKAASYRNHCKLHLGKKFVCEICGQAFIVERYLITHKRNHGIGKPMIPCTFESCPYKAFNPRSLEVHIQTVHEKRKDFVCEFCSKSFARKYHLKEHIENLHTKNPIILNCNICEKTFYTRKGLKTHSKYCPNPYPKSYNQARYMGKFRCHEPNCTREFTTNGARKRHNDLVHLKIFKFPCLECDKKFYLRSELKRHMMNKHHAEKPFSCVELDCNKSFPNLWSLERHRLQRHADDSEKLFKCVPCGLSYGTKESLYFHNMHHHDQNQHSSKSKKEKILHEPEEHETAKIEIQDPTYEIIIESS